MLDVSSARGGTLPLPPLAELSSEAVATLAGELETLESPNALLLQYLLNNPGLAAAPLEILASIFTTAALVGHVRLGRQIRALFQGKDVLDVGCGNTFFGAVFRALGARSYVGMDGRLDINRRQFRATSKKGYLTSPVTLRTVMTAIPHVDYRQVTQIDEEEAYDLAVMHMVTEHLSDVDGVFGQIARALRPGGRVWFAHDNFYSWAGHHMAPHVPKLLDTANPAHMAVADWAHINFDPPPDHPFRTNLNRIRIDELKRVTAAHFRILSWEEVPDASSVQKRLTPRIEARLKGYARRDLLTKHVVCYAEVR